MIRRTDNKGSDQTVNVMVKLGLRIEDHTLEKSLCYKQFYLYEPKSGKNTFWHVRSATINISLRTRIVLLESS